MKEDSKTISISPDELVAKLREVETSAQGDIARVIELLLVENHVLKRQQSVGLLRGASMQFEDFPRFLKLDEPTDTSGKNVGEQEESASEV